MSVAAWSSDPARTGSVSPSSCSHCGATLLDAILGPARAVGLPQVVVSLGLRKLVHADLEVARVRVPGAMPRDVGTWDHYGALLEDDR